MRNAGLLFAILLIGQSVVGANPTVIKTADELLDRGNVEASLDLLQSHAESADSSKTAAAILWRCSRASLIIGEIKEREGVSKKEVMEIYERGIEYAEKAIEKDSRSHQAYFYRASNIGKLSQMKSVFEAFNRVTDIRDDLRRAVTIKPDFSIAWYVLGILYEQVPGGIISFGNIEYSVSFARKSIETMQKELSSGDGERIYYDYYTELAKHLYKRNWSSERRKREHPQLLAQYKKQYSIFDKTKFFEGTVDLEPVSDRTEAKTILTRIIDELEPKSTSEKYAETYNEARETFDRLF